MENSSQDNTHTCSGTVGEDEIRVTAEQVDAVVETLNGGQGCSKDRLVDTSCSTDCNNIALLSSQCLLEFDSFRCGETVAAADHVGSLCVSEV